MPAARVFFASPPHSRRRGFTLMELLVVMGIIAFLAGILITVVKGVVGNARIAATKATIRKIDALLTRRMESFNRYIQDQDVIAAKNNKTPSYVSASLQRSASGVNQAKVLGRKDMFRRAFPQRFTEMDSPPSYDTTKHSSETESAELLYYFLTKMPAYGADSAASDAFSSSEVADTDGDGLLEFVDGWGKPLRFYRWPTRLVRPQLTAGSLSSPQSVTNANMMTPHEDWTYLLPVNPTYNTSGASLNLLINTLPQQPAGTVRGPGATMEGEHNDPLAQDPDDPMHRLHLRDYATAATQATNMENEFHTGDTYHTPLIVSVGIDGILGLYEPNDTTNFGRLAQPDLSALDGLLDNITNRNLQAGAGGQ